MNMIELSGRDIGKRLQFSFITPAGVYLTVLGELRQVSHDGSDKVVLDLTGLDNDLGVLEQYLVATHSEVEVQ